MEDFTQELVEVLKGMAGPEIRVILRKEIKVNDRVFQAINLLQPECSLSRSFYPAEYYGDYCIGISMATIAGEILHVFQEDALRAEMERQMGVSDLFDFERMKRQIYCRLVNLRRNRKYLKDKCYAKWLDLAVCFYIMTEDRDDSCTMLDVTEEMRMEWDVSEQELLLTALENVCNDYPARIVDVNDLAEMGVSFSGYMNPPQFSDEEFVYALINRMDSDRAIALFYPDVLKNFAEAKGVDEIVIFPSSRHEIILMPVYPYLKLNAEICSRIVGEINEEVIQPEDFLGDHAYLYIWESDEIKIFE